MTVDWTSLIVALLALGGSIYTARQAHRRAKSPTIVDQAGQVSALATDQMTRMATELREIKDELDEAEATNARLRRRVNLLEYEVIRLGGDPALIHS